MADSTQVLLTRDDVLRLRDEREVATRELAAATYRMERLDAKLNALRLILPDGVVNELFGRVGPRPETRSHTEGGRTRKWAPAVFRMLEEAGHGLTTADIRKRLEGTELAEQVGPYGNALYNALSKMVAKRELIKDGEHYCLPRQGKPEGAANNQRGADYQAAILAALVREPLGSGDIITALRSSPVADRIGKSASYVYTVLSRMAAAGEINKEGALYSLPHKENEPPYGHPLSGSEPDFKGELESPKRSSPQPIALPWD